MPRKVDSAFDKEVLEYLKTHSWIETQTQFDISSRTIKLMKDRNLEITQDEKSNNVKNEIGLELKEDIQKLVQLFYKSLEIPDFLKLASDSDVKAISRLELIK